MKGTLLSTVIENISTRKDNTVKITLGTQELSPSKAAELFQMLNKLAVTYISTKEITQREIDQVDKIDPEFQGKTQSQRIRNVLFILFEQNSEGFRDFDSFYKNKTEAYIDNLKTKLK